MGHNAFVERYDRPNYKLHVIIFMAIAGVSIVLATQVEKSRDKADIAALKAPVPIDSIAMDENSTAEQISPSIKPPVAANTTATDDAQIIPASVESSQEYHFEDSPNLESISTQLVAVNSESGVEDDVTAVAETTVAESEPVMQDTEILADQAIEADQAGGAVVSLDQVFQQQHDRFLETLAKTAEVETKESEEIKQLREAIRSDKPLAAGKSQSVNSTTLASEGDDKVNKKHIVDVKSERSSSEQNLSVAKQKVVKHVANVQPVVRQLTTGNAPDAVAMQTRLNTAAAIVMTKGELDRVVNQFTKSYNAGDINRLMALFDENARTNDQQSKLGIKADYAELFNNTKYRKLMINDINWQLGKGKAEGAAEFVVTVQAKNGLEESSFRGQIKITAIKHSRGVYITRLLHELKQ